MVKLPLNALAEREDHVGYVSLLDKAAVCHLIFADLLILEQRLVIDAFDHEDAEAGEEEYLK